MLTDEDRDLAAFASRHHGVFSLADAVRNGLNRGQIRERVAHDWIRCHEGVFRMPGAPDTWFARLAAAASAAGSSGAISHRSGAALYGLPGGRTHIREITCARWRRAQQDGLVVHESRRLQADDISQVEGIAVTCPERIVLDLASIGPRQTRRNSYPISATEAVDHVRFDARLFPAARTTWPARNGSGSCGARAVGSRKPRDGERDGNAAAPDPP